MKKPIFVIGVGRFGSVMLMNVLNSHSEIFIDNEINNKEPYAKIANNNHKIAKENFTKEVITKRFLEHYKEVYGNK